MWVYRFVFMKHCTCTNSDIPYFQVGFINTLRLIVNRPYSSSFEQAWGVLKEPHTILVGVFCLWSRNGANNPFAHNKVK